MESGVDGEVFLRYLHDHLLRLEQETGLTKVSLPLNPSCIAYLYLKFSDLNAGSQRSYNVRSISSVKPLTRSNLLDLQYYLENIHKLRLDPTVKDVFEDKSEIMVTTLFPSLRELEIYKCKPTIILDLDELSFLIQKVTVIKSIDLLSELLLPKNAPPVNKQLADVAGDPRKKRWAALRELRVSNNFIVNLDESLSLLQFTETLDLSHNLIERIENLQHCYGLLQLDLGFNRIKTLQYSVEALGNLRVLNLRNNGLNSTLGLEKLPGLEKLDLSENDLTQMEDIARVATLPFLDVLWLQGNPIALAPHFRKDVFILFAKEHLMLDDEEPSGSEREAARSQSHFQGDRARRAPPISIHTRTPPPEASGQSPGSSSLLTSTGLVSPAGGDLVSPAGSMKYGPSAKKKKKRVAAIEDSRSDERKDDNPSPSNLEEAAYGSLKDVTQHKQAIDQLHEGHGQSWLVVYNELKKNEQKSPSHAAGQKKAKGRGSDVKATRNPDSANGNPESAALSPSASSAALADGQPQKRVPMIISIPVFGPDGTENVAPGLAAGPASASPPDQSSSPPPASTPPSSYPNPGASILSQPSYIKPLLQSVGSVGEGPGLSASPHLSVGILGSSPGFGYNSPLNASRDSTGRDGPQTGVEFGPASGNPAGPSTLGATPAIPVPPHSAQDLLQSGISRSPTPSPGFSPSPPPNSALLPSASPVANTPPASMIKVAATPSPEAPAGPLSTPPQSTNPPSTPSNLSDFLSGSSPMTTAPPPLATRPSDPAALSDAPPPLASRPTEQPKPKPVEDVSDTVLPMDEFFVSVQTGRNDWEDRILLVTAKSIDENDTDLGSSVVKHDIKQLTNVQEISKDGESKVIRLDFRSKLGDSTHHTVCLYRMENDVESGKFYRLLKDVLKNSTKKIQCMQCNTIFNLQELDACSKCNSTYLVMIDQFDATAAVSAPSPKKDEEPPRSLLESSSSAAKKYSYQEEDDSLEVNKQMYLRMTFFKKDDTSEKFLTYLKTLYLPYNESTTKETAVSIMMSSFAIYILQPKKRRTMLFTNEDDMYNDEELLACHPFTDIKRFVVGPFWQYFRIEVNGEQVYTFTTRSHRKVHNFLSILKQNRPLTGFVEIINKNKETTTSLTDCAFSGASPRLEFFFWVLQKTRGSSFRQFARVAKGGANVSLTPKTFVATPLDLFLMDEDYGHWPSVNLPTVPKPKTPQFQNVAKRSITDVARMELDEEASNYVKLVFEESTDPKPENVWHIFTVGMLERDVIVRTLRKLWEQDFQIPMTIGSTNDGTAS